MPLPSLGSVYGTRPSCLVVGKVETGEPLHKQSAMKRFMCMHILNRNVIVAQRTVTKIRFFEA